MSLRSSISDAWQRFQGELFPSLAGEVGPLGVRHGRFIAVLDLVEVERHVHYSHRGVGNPPADRRALARAFVAKAVWDMPTTVVLVDRLLYDPTLRRLCGWSRVSEVPSESTFSRAFAWFAETRLPERMHEALVRSAYAGSVVGHISRDSTAIVGRERPAPKLKPQERPKRKRGRPKKGEEVPREPTRLERQPPDGMTAAEMADGLPKACDTGTKRNAKGYKESWRGYKLHIDAADGDVPVSCILTSASLHDSQAAIPLSRMTALRVDHCYELMDAAYDSLEIGFHAYLTGRVAITDTNPRRDAALKERLRKEALAQRKAGHIRHDRVRYRQRSSVERVNSALKDSYGARHVPRPWARQGGLPPVLRRAGPDGGTADAAHHLTPSVPAGPSATDAAPEGTARPAMRGRRPSGHQLRHSATPWPVQTPRAPVGSGAATLAEPKGLPRLPEPQ